MASNIQIHALYKGVLLHLYNIFKKSVDFYYIAYAYSIFYYSFYWLSIYIYWVIISSICEHYYWSIPYWLNCILRNLTNFWMKTHSFVGLIVVLHSAVGNFLFPRYLAGSEAFWNRKSSIASGRMTSGFRSNISNAGSDRLQFFGFWKTTLRPTKWDNFHSKICTVRKVNFCFQYSYILFYCQQILIYFSIFFCYC